MNFIRWLANISHPNSVDLDFDSNSCSQFVKPTSPFLEPPPPVHLVRPVSVLLPKLLHHLQFVGPALSPSLEPPLVDFVWPVSALPGFLHHSRSCSHWQSVKLGPPFLEPPPVDFVWQVSAFFSEFPHHLSHSRFAGPSLSPFLELPPVDFVWPASPFGLDDFDSRSRWQVVGPASPLVVFEPLSLLLFSSYVVNIVETAQDVFTFCFCLRASASLERLEIIVKFCYAYIKLRTYSSLFRAKLVEDFGSSFWLLAAFFRAFSRSCSRWFPPRAPRDFDGESTALERNAYLLISSCTYESWAI